MEMMMVEKKHSIEGWKTEFLISLGVVLLVYIRRSNGGIISTVLGRLLALDGWDVAPVSFNWIYGCEEILCLLALTLLLGVGVICVRAYKGKVSVGGWILFGLTILAGLFLFLAKEQMDREWFWKGYWLVLLLVFYCLTILSKQHKCRIPVIGHVFDFLIGIVWLPIRGFIRIFQVWGEAARRMKAGEKEEKKFIGRALWGLVAGIAIVWLILILYVVQNPNYTAIVGTIGQGLCDADLWNPVLLILSGMNILLSSAWLYGFYSQLFME